MMGLGFGENKFATPRLAAEAIVVKQMNQFLYYLRFTEVLWCQKQLGIEIEYPTRF